MSFWYNIIRPFTLGIGVQYFSGNDQMNPSGKENAFVPLYGTGHKFNGWMDYFYAGSGHGKAGLINVYVPATFKKDKLTAEMQLHYYMTSAKVKNLAKPTEAMPAELGFEPGIMLTYAFTPEINIQLGYSQMFGTKTLQTLKKSGNNELTQNWAWISMNFTPNFFKYEK